MKIANKKKIKKISLLLAAAAPAAIVAAYALLTYRPASYVPFEQTADGNEVSSYLTHELAPQFYNGLGKREPFELVLIEPRINDVICRLQCPVTSESISVSNPVAGFSANGLVIMCTAQIKGMTCFVTVRSAPGLDEKGLLNLNINSVKLGAVPITGFGRSALETIIRAICTADKENPDNFASKIALSISENKPFDPVFTLDGKKIRITKISFENEKLTIGFAPAEP